MSHFLKDRPHLWHGNLMKLILTVGVLSILAVSEIKAQTGHSIATEFATPASIEAGMTTTAHAERVCKQTHNRRHQSECQPCRFSPGGECHPGSSLVSKQNCPYNGYGVQTCRVMCEEVYTTESCCHGFWGDGCIQECPGGRRNPCNGHGKCSSKNGQCVCEPGFEGTACELFTNVTKYGPNWSVEADVTTPAHAERVCKHTYKRTHQSECQFCSHSHPSPCHNGSVEVALKYCSDGETCQFVCEEEYTEYCCHGFWGDGCIQECPGGSGSPCNGHGECSNKHGQCACELGFGGAACELCTDETKYGPNCSLEAGTATRAQIKRFCKQTYKRKFEIENQRCIISCPPGSRSGAHKFCSASGAIRVFCEEEYTPEYCCHGFWGDGCMQECPGGSGNPCNGHGRCLSKYGVCACQPGFGGTACELCTDVTKYGPNCSLDCNCEDGECNNGIHGDGLCARENPCQSPMSPCGNNSQCIHTGAGRHRCACHDGYAGDGTVCAPINPCQNNSGGCDVTTDCIYTGPNQYKCQCKKGYEGDNPDKGCTIKGICSPGICGPNAVCQTKEPLKHSCVCNEGYTWNGTLCEGNLIKENVTSVKASASTASHANTAGVAVAVVVLTAIIAIVIYKKRHHLYMLRCPSRFINISYSKKKSQEAGDTVSIPDNTQYENPLFQ